MVVQQVAAGERNTRSNKGAQRVTEPTQAVTVVRYGHDLDVNRIGAGPVRDDRKGAKNDVAIPRTSRNTPGISELVPLD